MARLAPTPGERLLLPGIGTGLDLLLLPAGVVALGVDVSEPMLARARRRIASSSAGVELRLGDAARIDAASSSFDAAALNLVLSVVPDPAAVLAEAVRLVRPGGRIVVFDKLAPDERPTTKLRRVLSLLTSVFGTAIDRQIGDLVTRVGHLEIESNEPSLLRGQYRVVVLRRA